MQPPAPRPPGPPRPTAADRRYRLTHRALPLAGIALVSLLTGLVVGALHVPAERSLRSMRSVVTTHAMREPPGSWRKNTLTPTWSWQRCWSGWLRD